MCFEIQTFTKRQEKWDNNFWLVDGATKAGFRDFLEQSNYNLIY